MPIFSDTFTDTTGTCLFNHTPTTGASWYELFATSATLIIGSPNDVRTNFNTDNQGITYGVATGPVVNDFEIGITLTAVATGTQGIRWRLLGRLTDIANYYSAEFLPTGHASNDSTIYKKVGGTKTALGSVDTGLLPNDVMLFRVTDENKVLYKNGTCIISTNDNAITALGTVGFAAGYIDANDGGRPGLIWAGDDFLVQELDVICTKSAQQTVYRM